MALPFDNNQTAAIRQMLAVLEDKIASNRVNDNIRREVRETIEVVSLVDLTATDSVRPTADRLFNKLKELCILLIGGRAMVTQNRIAQEAALAGIILPTKPPRVIV